MSHEDEKAKQILDIVERLNALDDEERYVVFCMYCTRCGSKNLPCSCMRDE